MRLNDLIETIENRIKTSKRADKWSCLFRDTLHSKKQIEILSQLAALLRGKLYAQDPIDAVLDIKMYLEQVVRQLQDIYIEKLTRFRDIHTFTKIADAQEVASLRSKLVFGLIGTQTYLEILRLMAQLNREPLIIDPIEPRTANSHNASP